ncbi:hypothetical protein CSQ92_04965 [Janthinobacterium sp. BJB446]|nr:hypothetical protein CSQ92_04965 [Janthinobacterium sp. BJB446]
MIFFCECSTFRMWLHPYLAFLYINDCDSDEVIAFLIANNLNLVPGAKTYFPKTPANPLAAHAHAEDGDRISVTCGRLCAVNSA